jgi:5-methyltetrahydropteroyltriglutamate--homocysteine methyltransferase
MIRTSHVGSLPRPPELLAAIAEREAGGPELDPAVVRAAVAESVRRQVEVGLDIVNDGESAKVSYVTYVRNRLTGFAPASRSPERPDPAAGDFPEWAAARRARRAAAAPVQIPVCRDEIHYPDTGPVDADIAALRAALAEHPDREAFLTAASPGVIALFLADEHYRDREAYLDALAEAMKVEYDAVYAAGLLLQLDCPDLAVTRAAFAPDENGLREYRWLVTQNVAALNQALRDIPPERVRLHMCWGNYEGPHHRDVALRDVLDIVLGAHAQTISFEGANPRHGHEWALFEEITLPADKSIMPGVIDSTTHYVEHPDLVAQRIERYAAAVGEERVVAATDCGMATFATADDALDPRVAWAKLESLVQGAALVNGWRAA